MFSSDLVACYVYCLYCILDVTQYQSVAISLSHTPIMCVASCLRIPRRARRAVIILRFSDMIVVGGLGGLSLSDNTRGKIMFNRATLDDDRSYKLCPLWSKLYLCRLSDHIVLSLAMCRPILLGLIRLQCFNCYIVTCVALPSAWHYWSYNIITYIYACSGYCRTLCELPLSVIGVFVLSLQLYMVCYDIWAQMSACYRFPVLRAV